MCESLYSSHSPDDHIIIITHRPVADVEHAAVEHGLGAGDDGHVAGVLGVEVGAAGRGVGEGAAVYDHLIHGVDPGPLPGPAPRLLLSLENLNLF